MDDNTDKKKLPRRDFLETGLLGGIGLTLGLAASSMLKSKEDEAPEMIKMLTADGKLVEIEKRLIPPMCGKPVAVSNQEIIEWMEEGKK